MRNYIKTFWCVIHATFNNGVDPPVEFDFKPFGATPEKLNQSIIDLENLTIGTDDPTFWTFNLRLEPFPVWFLLDKFNVCKMMDVIRDFFFDECIMDPSNDYEPIPPDIQLLRCELESPRGKTWTDSEGVRIFATPSDKGNFHGFMLSGDEFEG